MRVLINALVPSHVLPMVPLTWALRAAGHDVVFLGHADTVRAATEAGLPTWRVGPDDGGAQQWKPPVRRKDPFSAPGSSTKLPELDPVRMDMMGQRWRDRLDGYVDDYLAFARHWRPDLIMTDPMEFSGLVVAAALHVPAVVHRFGVDNFTSVLIEPTRKALRETCLRLGAADGFPDPAMVIDPCPPSIQSPNVPVGTPIRYLPYNGTAGIAPWSVELPPGPRVCLAFGMWSMTDLAKHGELRAVLDGVGAALDKHGAGTAFLLVPAHLHDDLGAVPDRIRLVDAQPIGYFLRDIDLMVHHGGSGSALTSLYHGVPQLVVAQDGPMLVPCAERIAASGVGYAIIDDAERRDPDAIAEGVGHVLGSPGYTEAAGRVAAEIAGLPAAAHIVDRLVDLTAGWPAE